MRARTVERARCRAEGVRFIRDPGSRHPFKLAIRINEMLFEASKLKGKEAQYQAFLKIPEYKSRGHGGRHPVKARQNYQDRSKYMPAECNLRGCR